MQFCFDDDKHSVLMLTSSYLLFLQTMNGDSLANNLVTSVSLDRTNILVGTKLSDENRAFFLNITFIFNYEMKWVACYQRLIQD